MNSKELLAEGKRRAEDLIRKNKDFDCFLIIICENGFEIDLPPLNSYIDEKVHAEMIGLLIKDLKRQELFCGLIYACRTCVVHAKPGMEAIFQVLPVSQDPDKKDCLVVQVLGEGGPKSLIREIIEKSKEISFKTISNEPKEEPWICRVDRVLSRLRTKNDRPRK